MMLMLGGVVWSPLRTSFSPPLRGGVAARLRKKPRSILSRADGVVPNVPSINLWFPRPTMPKRKRCCAENLETQLRLLRPSYGRISSVGNFSEKHFDDKRV